MVHSLPRALRTEPSAMGKQAGSVFLWEIKWSRSGTCLPEHRGDSLRRPGGDEAGTWPRRE